MMEHRHEPEEWQPRLFLREFLGCDDVVPKDYRRLLLELTGVDDEQEIITYARAAHSLLCLLPGEVA
jgi:hypothetical protein